MAAPRKYSDDYRQAIHQLVNEQDRPATQAAALIARGHSDLEPLTIPVETVRLIARQQRGDLTDQPKSEQLRTLVAGMVRLYDTEITRLQAEQGPLDADAALKVTQGIKTLEPFLTDKPAGKDEKPQGLLGNLGANDETQATEPTTGNVVAVRSLRSQSQGPQSA